jgi:hypothetical protein
MDIGHSARGVLVAFSALHSDPALIYHMPSRIARRSPPSVVYCWPEPVTRKPQIRLTLIRNHLQFFRECELGTEVDPNSALSVRGKPGLALRGVACRLSL